MVIQSYHPNYRLRKLLDCIRSAVDHATTKASNASNEKQSKKHLTLKDRRWRYIKKGIVKPKRMLNFCNNKRSPILLTEKSFETMRKTPYRCGLPEWTYYNMFIYELFNEESSYYWRILRTRAWPSKIFALKWTFLKIVFVFFFSNGKRVMLAG